MCRFIFETLIIFDLVFVIVVKVDKSLENYFLQNEETCNAYLYKHF